MGVKDALHQLHWLVLDTHFKADKISTSKRRIICRTVKYGEHIKSEACGAGLPLKIEKEYDYNKSNSYHKTQG